MEANREEVVVLTKGVEKIVSTDGMWQHRIVDDSDAALVLLLVELVVGGMQDVQANMMSWPVKPGTVGRRRNRRRTTLCGVGVSSMGSGAHGSLRGVPQALLCSWGHQRGS